MSLWRTVDFRKTENDGPPPSSEMEHIPLIPPNMKLSTRKWSIFSLLGALPPLKGCAGAKESSELTLPSLSFPRSPSRAGFSRTLRSNHPFHAEETRSLWGRRGPRLGASCVRSVHLEKSAGQELTGRGARGRDPVRCAWNCGSQWVIVARRSDLQSHSGGPVP